MDVNRPQKQHVVNVSRADGELSARPGRLEIAKGDIVSWSGDQSVGVGFRVRGWLGETAIDSTAMHDESIFSHAFGLPGETQWADANGSGLRGVVHVAEVESGVGDRHEAWLGAVEQGTLVRVKGSRATPKRVEIVVGQTVIWAAHKAPGVTITDVRLIGA